MKLLIVDDSKAVHAYIRSLFADSGYTLESYFDGSEAVEKAAAYDPDIVLMDWEMPQTTGVEAVKALREAGFNKPIIMVTTLNSPKQIAQALACGATEYVMKPFTKEILEEKIQLVKGVAA